MDGRGDNTGKPHEVKSDAELHADAMAGGPEAFGFVVERYKDAVFGIALARVGDFHAAEDIAQNVLVAAFERLGSLKEPSRLGAWLRSITIHQSIDYVRARRPVVEAQYERTPASEEHEPGAHVARKELHERVLAAIGRLSRTQRETTTLFYVNGYSVAEVATFFPRPSHVHHVQPDRCPRRPSRWLRCEHKASPAHHLDLKWYITPRRY